MTDRATREEETASKASRRARFVFPLIPRHPRPTRRVFARRRSPSARACLVERAYPIDAAFIDASIRAACACLRVPFALLTSLERVRTVRRCRARSSRDPRAVRDVRTVAHDAHRDARGRVPDASRPRGVDDVRVRVAIREKVSRILPRFKSRAIPRRVAAMDPDAIRPAFLGVFRATIAFARVAPMTTARDAVAAAEAVAAVEFARAPDSNYAPALQRIAAAMSADHPSRATRASRSSSSRSRTSANSTRPCPCRRDRRDLRGRRSLRGGRVGSTPPPILRILLRAGKYRRRRVARRRRLRDEASPAPPPLSVRGAGPRFPRRWWR